MSDGNTPRRLAGDELREFVHDRVDKIMDERQERVNQRRREEAEAPVATGVRGRAEQRRDDARDQYGQLPQNARDDNRPQPRTNKFLERRARRRHRYDPDKESDEDAARSITNDDGGGRRTRSYRERILKTKKRIAENGDDDR